MNAYLKLVDSGNGVKDHGFEELVKPSRGKSVYANLRNAAFRLKLGKSKDLYLYGDVFYHIESKDRIKMLDSGSGAYLTKLFSKSPLQQVIPALEGQYLGIVVDREKNSVTFFSDRYARKDYFYASQGREFFLGTDLDFIFKHVKPQYDQKMLAHLFCVYGWYTPKGTTIYSNVKRLKVGEILTVSSEGVDSQIIPFKPLDIEDYQDKDLLVYEKLLRESVRARANRKGKTWVSSSSGWDSSVLLGVLVDEFGSKNVGMVTGNMKYSKNSDVINLFEMNKIKKIASHYGIKPEIVDLDFKNKSASAYWKKILPFFKSKHMYTFSAFNFTRISDGLTSAAGEGQTIFNGETSDSFHNFGFSQFVTFFHSQKPFTEYADKMNCYLYGPTFLKKVFSGTHEKDKVYQIFQKMNSGAEYAPQTSSREDLVESYLFPFFYGGPRVPFAKTQGNAMLTPGGQNAVYHYPFREYMPEALSLNEKNLYSWLIYLYHSFHSQGSTVNIQKHAMEKNQQNWRSPYNDYRLVEFLSKAPERWGRGLELNHTKYPIKWLAQNRLKFPYELLQEGPHSYLYDVMEGFSLFAEVVYRSGVTSFLKEAMAEKSYRNVLQGDTFALGYLDRLADDFVNGKEAKGADFNNLVSLITFVITGWY